LDYFCFSCSCCSYITNMFLSFSIFLFSIPFNKRIADYLHFVLEYYVQKHVVLFLLIAVLGSGGLSYSYYISTTSYISKIYPSRNLIIGRLTKKEALYYSVYILNLLYLSSFLFAQWIIDFNSVIAFIYIYFYLILFVFVLK
jgi:hypothetical protein